MPTLAELHPELFGLPVTNRATNPTFTSELKNAVPRSLGQGIQGFGQIAEDLGWEDNPIKDYGQRVIERNPTQINSLEDIADHPMAALGSGIGNAVGFMVPAGAIGTAGKMYGLGRGAMLGAQTVNAGVPSYGGIRENQIRDGNNSPVDMLTAGAGALAVGAVENAFGVQRIPGFAKMLGIQGEKQGLRAMVGGLSPTAVRSGAMGVVKSAAGEGFEELIQNPIEQVAAYQDPTSQEAIDETLFGGAMGALGGLGLGGVGGFQAYGRHKALAQQLAPYNNQYSQNPVDLLRAVNTKDALDAAEATTGSYADYTQFQNTYRQGLEEAAGLQGAQDERMAEIGLQRQSMPTTDQFHTDLAYQNAWREAQMPYGYGAIDPSLEVPTVPPRYAAPVDPDLPMPGRPTTPGAVVAPVVIPTTKAKPVKEPKVPKYQQEIDSILTQAAQMGFSEQEMTALEEQAKARKVAGVKKLFGEIQAARVEKPPVHLPTAEEKLAAEAANDAAARNLATKLLTALPKSKDKHGNEVDFASTVATYFGFEGSNDEKLDAVAKAHGLKSRQSAQYRVKRAVEMLKTTAAKMGITVEQAADSIRALAESRKTDLNLTDDQLEIAKLTGSLDQAVESENQGKLDFTDAKQQGLLSRELQANPVTEAAATDDITGALTGEQAQDQAEFEQQDLDDTVSGWPSDPEEAYQAAKLRLGDEGKAQAVKRAVAMKAAQLAKSDAKGKLEEVVRGQTEAPTYAHEPEEYAMAQDSYEYSVEMLARQGQSLPAWDTLDQQAKDELTQLYKSELNSPTGRINERHMESMYVYYTDEAAKRTASRSNTERRATSSSSATVQESGGTVPAEAKPKAKRKAPAKPKQAAKQAPSPEDEVATLWDTLAGAYNLPVWKGLAADDRAAIMEAHASGDQVRLDNAANAVATKLLGLDEESGADYRTKKQHGTGMSKAEFQRILDAFVAKYKGAAQLNLIVEPDDAKFIAAGVRGVQGAYYAASRKIVFVASNHGEVSEALETIQHELLGHFGLDLLRPADKQQILDTVKAAAKVNPKLAEIYDAEVAEAKGDTNVAAGETLANIAESKLSIWNTLLDKIASLWNRGLIKVGLRPADFKTVGDLRNQVRMAAKALALGARQQTIPANDQLLFRQRAESSTTQPFLDTLSDVFQNAKGFFKEAGLGWLTLEQLADVVKSKAVTGYNNVMVAMQQMSKDIVYRASQIDQAWDALTPDVSKRLSDVMRTATREQTDPEKGEGTPELKAKFNALPQDAKELYKRVRDFYADNYETRKQIMLDAANKAKLAGKNVDEVNRMFAKMKGPYFPLMRIGRWYAVGMTDEVKALYDKQQDGTITKDEQKRYDALRKDGTKYKSSAFNSRAEARRAAKEMEAEFGNGRFNVAEERLGSMMASMPDLPQVEAYLSDDMPKEVRAHVKNMMTQMIFDMLPEHHALKQQMKREGIHGEEQDMRRVFAQSALSQAHYMSRLKYANGLSAAMTEVRAEGRGGNETMRMVRNELVKRNALAMDTEDHPMVDRLLQGSYFAHLGMSPAFILTNMSQVPMITAPWLGARHGFGTSGRALAAAYGDVVKMMKSTYGKEGVLAELNWKDHLNAAESTLFQILLDRNLLDITIEHDLGSVAQMQNTKLDKYIKYANSPVRITELANRAVTGLAAYRLAKAKGMSEEQAVEHAAKAISETQLNYSGLNAPRHMRSVLGSKAAAKLMFQFRKYQQGMIYLVAKNFYDAVKGQSAEEKAIARRTLLGLFGTTGLMAGSIGVPFAGSLMFVAGLIGGAFDDDDDPFDPEVEYRNWLTDVFGKDAALVLAKGLPTLFNIDLSKRVGMGDLGSPLPFMRQGKTGTETVGNALAAAAGPAIGTVATMYDGLQELGKGQYAKGAEKIVPLKAAQNLIRAGRYGTEGLTNKNGEIVLPEEKFSAWDLTMRGVGFQPIKESEYYAANQAVEGAKQAATETRSKLLREYAQAKMKGESVSEIEAKITDFNSRHNEKGVRIDYGSKVKAVQSRRKMALERDESGVKADKSTRRYLEHGRFAAGG